jgi:alpha-L-arabinofuranosidase
VKFFFNKSPWRNLLSACTLAMAAAGVIAAPDASEVRLTIQSEAAGPRIEPDVYGQFAEHLGAGIYGGLWVGPESKIPNTRGWRNDVVQALKQLEVPVVRWPGGCFADDYDWRDGIGDPAKRPARLNRWWGGAETNRVGTHEFMDMAEQLGAEVVIAGNIASMTPKSMSHWMEYMTGADKSALTDERRHNGRDKPWKVKYIGVGNESWGCGGNMRPEYQSDLHNQYATFLPNGPKRVASGDGQGNDHLIEVLMQRSINQMDALTLHYYTMIGDWDKKGPALGFDADIWAKTIKSAKGVETRITAIKAIMDKYDADKRVGLYVDEWGTWFDTAPGASALYQQNTLRDAMVAAVSLNVFQRHTDRVRMTNIAQMVNVLQAMVLTDGDKMLLTPTYHVFDMYKPFKGATPLKIQVQSPSFKRGDTELASVEASVARTADGKVVLALTNLDPDRPARVSTGLKAAVRGRILTAATMDAHNTFDQPKAIEPADFSAQPGPDGLTLDLPAKSIVVVTVAN